MLMELIVDMESRLWWHSQHTEHITLLMKSVIENVLTYTKKEYQATADTAWLDARTVGMYGMEMPNAPATLMTSPSILLIQQNLTLTRPTMAQTHQVKGL